MDRHTGSTQRTPAQNCIADRHRRRALHSQLVGGSACLLPTRRSLYDFDPHLQHALVRQDLDNFNFLPS